MGLSLRRALFYFGMGVVIGLSSCSRLPLDTAVSAAEGHDSTVILQGCNQTPGLGYLFCRVRETTLPSEVIVLTVPKVDCKRQSCVVFQLVRKDGSLGYAGSILKGEENARFLLSDVIGNQAQISMDDDGEYQALVRVYYLDDDGNEHEALMRGFIRVAVLTANYVPVGCNDPAMAWEVTLQEKPKCSAQWTSLLRGSLCGICGES